MNNQQTIPFFDIQERETKQLRFELQLFDSRGNKLELGDIVKISDGVRFNFFAEVKYLPDEKVITPFHTFSFHSFEKVDKVPDHAIPAAEERYKIWFTHSAEIVSADARQEAQQYLMDWRQCEHLLESKCFRIEMIDP